MKIIGYMLLSSNDAEELSDSVDALLPEYQPFGSPSVSVSVDPIDQEQVVRYVQAVVQYE